MTTKDHGQALVDAAATAAQADAAAQLARQEWADAQQAAHDERHQRHMAVWQGWADGYDHRDISAEIRTAEAALRDALASTDLGAALTGYIAAMMRQDAAQSLAAEALAHGATLAHPLPTRAVETLTGDPGGFVIGKLASLAVDIARTTVAAETDAVRTAAEIAYGSVHVSPATSYRVALRDGRDLTDHIGGIGAVTFRGGVAMVSAADLGDEQVASLLRYWRSLPDTYQITEVW